MKKRNLLLAALLLILVAPSFAAKVDTLLVNSPSMNKDVLCRSGQNQNCCDW